MSLIGCDKRDATLFLDLDYSTLPFGFEIGKIVKYAGHNSDQLDLIIEKISRAGAASSQAVRAKDYGPSRKSDHEKSRGVSSVGTDKMDWLISHS